jgi:hypothetical protein
MKSVPATSRKVLAAAIPLPGLLVSADAEYRLAHCDRIVVPVFGKVLDETGDDRGVTRGHGAPAAHGEQVIRALVILMPGAGLAPDKVMIEKLLTTIGHWRRHSDRWRTVVNL